MTEIELLRHVLKNREEGKPAGDGLLVFTTKSVMEKTHEINWKKCDAYSLAPKTQIINGQEVPAPLEDLTGMIFVYVLNLSSDEFYTSHQVECMSNEYVKRLLERGLVFASKEDVIKVAKAMLNIKD